MPSYPIVYKGDDRYTNTLRCSKCKGLWHPRLSHPVRCRFCKTKLRWDRMRLGDYEPIIVDDDTPMPPEKVAETPLLAKEAGDLPLGGGKRRSIEDELMGDIVP